MRSFCYVLFGIFLLKFADGRVANSQYGEETLHSYAHELLKPLMSKTNELNNTLQDYWANYDKNMNQIDSRFKSLNRLGTNVMAIKNDTCKELQETMAKAQSIVNDATVVMVEVMQKMAYVIDQDPSCATINVFTAMSCLAHKAQNVRNIYRDYKDQIIEKEVAAGKAVGQILVEFINCFKRL
nr:uncharacterized protein LOC106685945 [Halyomorpha halys]